MGAVAVAFKLVCPNRQSEAPADAVATPPLDQLTIQPVTLTYVTVLIHSTEYWNSGMTKSQFCFKGNDSVLSTTLNLSTSDVYDMVIYFTHSYSMYIVIIFSFP